MTDRILNPIEIEDDNQQTSNENILRPKNFSEYIGQKRVVENIELMVKSAKLRKTALDHILLSGPPGLGKTSLAMLVAKEMGTTVHVLSGPSIEKKGDLASILASLEEGDILFIDEIHRINISVEEFLYSAMEDFRLDIVLGQGPASRTMQINLKPFTLIGATTRSGLLSNPLRDRFLANLHFNFYTCSELQKIVENNCKKLGIKSEEKGSQLIAKCSRGTPRIANRILRRVRDLVTVEGTDIISSKEVKKALDLMEIDSEGLDLMDRKILNVIQEYYGGGPVGIDALCATLSEDKSTIEDVYEPYLLQEGYLIRTPRGRENSPKAKDHLSQYAHGRN